MRIGSLLMRIVGNRPVTINPLTYADMRLMIDQMNGSSEYLSLFRTPKGDIAMYLSPSCLESDVKTLRLLLGGMFTVADGGDGETEFQEEA